MSFQFSLQASILRCLLIAAVGLPLAAALRSWIAGSEGWSRTGRWSLALTPLFTPGLLIGYCYRDSMLALAHRPMWNEILYAALVAAQTIPFGLVILTFAPRPATSAAARHSALLASTRAIGTWRQRLWLAWHGDAGTKLAAAAGMFLIAFQEAEVASLLQTATWTEWLFTKQAGGLVNPVRYLVWIVPVELLCMAALLPWLRRIDSREASSIRRKSASWTVLVAQAWACLAVLLVTAIPVAMIVRGAWRGAAIVLSQPSFPREIVDALLVSATSAGAALGLILLVGQSRHRQLGLAGLAIPGLLGPLCLGLLLGEIFQTPALRWAYDSPVPLVLGETLFLLPRGIILWGCFMSAPRFPAITARLLARSPVHNQRAAGLELSWVVEGRRWFWGGCILCFWSYLELMLPSLLAPPGMAPAPLLLYNALHYGRIAALAAKLCICLLVPAVLAILVLGLRRRMAGWFLR